MKKSLFIMALLLVTGASFAQKKRTTTSATVSFDATTSLDKLPKAENKTSIAAIDTKKGTVSFEVIIKNFSFANPKMQEHFNSNGWMDSDKYPSAKFKGKITNLSAVNFKKDGSYNANIEGDLTMHGVTKKVTTTAPVVVKGKTINTTADLIIHEEDYGINGPAIGAGKVSKEPKISISAEFK